MIGVLTHGIFASRFVRPVTRLWGMKTRKGSRLLRDCEMSEWPKGSLRFAHHELPQLRNSLKTAFTCSDVTHWSAPASNLDR